MKLVDKIVSQGKFIKYYLEDSKLNRLLIVVTRVDAKLLEVYGNDNTEKVLCTVGRVNFSDNWRDLYRRFYEKLEVLC